jgi:hypothetical protein
MLHLSICTELRKIGAFVTFVVVGPKQLFDRDEKTTLELVTCVLLFVLALVSSRLILLVLALGLILLHFGTMYRQRLVVRRG